MSRDDPSLRHSGDQMGRPCTLRCLQMAFMSQVTNAAQRFGRQTHGDRAAWRPVAAVFGWQTRGRPLHAVELPRACFLFALLLVIVKEDERP